MAVSPRPVEEAGLHMYKALVVRPVASLDKARQMMVDWCDLYGQAEDFDPDKIVLDGNQAARYRCSGLSPDMSDYLFGSGRTASDVAGYWYNSGGESYFMYYAYPSARRDYYGQVFRSIVNSFRFIN